MRDAVDEGISCGELEAETAGDRAELAKYELAISSKALALLVLGPLGFEDNANGERPGAIYHSGAGVVIDANTIGPQSVVHELLRIGAERGVEALRRDLRAAIGL